MRSIGVSNYGVHHLDELAAHLKANPDRAAAAPLSVNQVELHPWLARRDITSWCAANGVVAQAYSPLSRTTRFKDARLQQVCTSTGRTPAQVLVRWSLEMGFVPLPKSVTESRIEENADVFGWELGAENVAVLTTDEYSPSAWDPTTSD